MSDSESFDDDSFETASSTSDGSSYASSDEFYSESGETATSSTASVAVASQPTAAEAPADPLRQNFDDLGPDGDGLVPLNGVLDALAEPFAASAAPPPSVAALMMQFERVARASGGRVSFQDYTRILSEEHELPVSLRARDEPDMQTPLQKLAVLVTEMEKTTAAKDWEQLVRQRILALTYTKMTQVGGDASAAVVRARLEVGRAYVRAGQLPPAMPHLRHCCKSCDALSKGVPGNVALTAQAFAALADLSVRMAQNRDALQHSTTGLTKTADALGDHVAVARLHQVKGRALFRLGKHPEGLDEMDRAREMLARVDPPASNDALVALHIQTAEMHCKGQQPGYRRAALAAYERALALLDADKQRLRRADSLFAMGKLQRQLGDPKAAAASFEAAVAAYEEHHGEAHKMTLRTWVNLCLSWAKLQRYADAIAKLGEVRKRVAAKAGKKSLKVGALKRLEALMHLGLGDVNTAIRILGEARAIYNEILGVYHAKSQAVANRIDTLNALDPGDITTELIEQIFKSAMDDMYPERVEADGS